MFIHVLKKFLYNEVRKLKITILSESHFIFNQHPHKIYKNVRYLSSEVRKLYIFTKTFKFLCLRFRYLYTYLHVIALKL